MERIQQSPAYAPEILDPLPTCSHIFPKGRHCRHAVANAGDFLCAAHAPAHTISAHPRPLAELAAEIGSASKISDVGNFIAKVIKLACQNRISFARATGLTYMANSLLNAMRIANYEARLAARDEDSEPPTIDWTGIPRPERERVHSASEQPLSDSLHTPVPA